MAVSPLIVPGGGERERSAATTKSKLSTAPSSSRATPEVQAQARNSGSSGNDVAEQMNENEKQKYVKGRFHT